MIVVLVVMFVGCRMLSAFGRPFSFSLSIYELQSKLLKGAYIGDYIGDYYRDY